MSIPFTYVFKNNSFESKATLCAHKSAIHYLVVLPDESEVAITSLEYEGTDRICWVQANRLDDILVPTEQVQAMGEAMNEVLRKL
ncbi:MAG TPA: hypothetical protein VGH64_07115 [Puia sp.]|jgi:hypothetical protein